MGCLPIRMDFTHIDARPAKKTQNGRVQSEEFLDELFARGVTTAAVLVVVHNPAAAIEFEVAALQQQVAQFFAGALYARFGTRQRQALLLRELLLTQALIFRQQQGLPIRFRQLVDHVFQRERQFRFRVVFGQIGVGWHRCPRVPPVRAAGGNDR